MGPRKLGLAILLLSLSLAASAAQEPRRSERRDVVETTLLQVDVSVLAPRSKSYRSVAGLTKEHFVVRLDGVELSPAARDALRVDEICTAEQAGQHEPSSLGSSMLALVDFNYLDARGRHRVADSLDALADAPRRRGERYKIYGFTRQLRLLTDGFTDDPEALRRAAEMVRQTAETRVLTTAENEGVPMEGEATLREALEEMEAIFSTLSPPRALSAEIRDADHIGDLRSSFDPVASLAALEGILRAHVQLPGRKAVLLFSSEAFRFAEEARREPALAELRQLMRRGFSIWTIDVEGISRENTGASELLSQLAQDSGGDSVRRTARMERAFTRAAEQLSCYYLVSVPQPPARRVGTEFLLTVKLDTERFPELWGHRVVAPSKIVSVDETTRRRGNRLAALLSPDDFPEPAVTATVDYPIVHEGKSVLPVRLRVALRDLTWLPVEGGVRARLLVDALVERDTYLGTELLCRIGADRYGELELRLPRPPRAKSDQGLVAELTCRQRHNGAHTLRGVVTDLEADAPGAGRSTVLIRRDGDDERGVHHPRLLAVSGRDLVWRPGRQGAHLDRARRAWRVIPAGSAVPIDDRLALSYVLCGKGVETTRRSLRHLLLVEDAAGAWRPAQAFPDAALELQSEDTDRDFCGAARLVLPEYSLEPGRYALAVVDAGTTTDALLQALAGSTRPGAASLGFLRFEVVD